jgi:GWxTD domain-containing protein
MKPRLSLMVLGILLAATAALAAQSQKAKIQNLNPVYRKWLEEDVVYIISPKERAVFLQLSNDRERNMFIEAFWRARDPDPATPQNEFKDEHYRRIAYANQWFGRGLTAGGWRSDMGRIYITLGEPKSIDRFENERDTYPIIIWFYEGLGDRNLPNAFNVVFFKKDGAGDYVLYSPVRDGPQKLMPMYNGDMTDYQAAYSELVARNLMEIAEVSLTLIPNEYLLGMSPSIPSDILIGQSIPASAYNGIKDAYAEKLLKYKDIIDVEYSANYVDSDAMVQVYRDARGQAFVHYLIEPSRLSLEQVEGLYRTAFEVNGLVSNSEGQTVYQFDRQIPVEITADQFAKIKDLLFCFQDMFPLIEGQYKVSVLWKNTVSHEFTSVEAALNVPPLRTLTMSHPLLAYRVLRSPELAAKVKPFTVGSTQYVASPRNDFAAKDTMAVFCELDGLTGSLRQTASMAVTITKDDKEVKAVVKPLRDYADAAHVVEEFPLADLQPAYYEVRVALLGEDKTEILSDKTRFYISLSPAVPRPWMLYAPLPPQGDPYYANTRGLQYMHVGDVTTARSLLEQAHRARPGDPKFALDLCRALFVVKDYETLKGVAVPFYQDQKKYEFAQFLGESEQALGRYAEAIGYYKDYLTYYGTNINVLNAVGECYVKVGDVQQALTAWRKSLELEPKQETLKAKVAELEKKVGTRP